MSGSFRLEQGGRIDRSKALRFTFDGKDYAGFAGDTLASALIANGIAKTGGRASASMSVPSTM